MYTHFLFVVFVLIGNLTATADVVFDQIGVMDGSSVGNSYASSQYFESTYPEYDIASLDNFSIETPLSFNRIECVVGGWNGFEDPTSITYFQGNIYGNPEDASQSLIGNVASWNIDSADSVVVDDWGGFGFLIDCPTTLIINQSGEFWVSLIPQNDFGPSGQTGIANSFIGDDVPAMQANPGEGFGFGPLQELKSELAIRLSSGVVKDPCKDPLPIQCSSDVNRDGVVSLPDLLIVIANWGACGDGINRPEGDVAPLPNGDCCVNLTDLLAVISDWSADCNEYGACCLSQGKCIENVLEEDCVLNGGVYGGHGTDCTAIECVAAACCIESTCSQLTESACIDAEGYFFEAESCGAFDCSSLSNGDECSNAINVTEGQFSFNTNYMTPSTPFPDDKVCASTNLNWGESADVWFVFTPVTNGYYRISTCDQESYDTSMVLYEGNCSTQIACNGDSEIEGDEEGCQLYYSSIQHELLPQSEYYIRVGGWKGATGAGALTISLVPDPLPGACCFETGSCIDTLIISECQNFGGVFQGEESVCSDGVCHVITSDECETAEQVFIGASSFDTGQSTPSEPFPDELACTDEFLNWGKSPDVWMHWIATYDGIVNFSTCDIDSFDTSLVVYESNCLNQIACNGDGYPNADCQTYYSSINVEVSLGETYYIRIGGWQGTIGEGKLIIDDSPTKKVGACCVEDSCLDSLPEVSCLNSGGTWHYSMECDSVTCDESTLCEDAFLTQFPMPGSEDWFAGTSASDAIQGIDYKLSEFIDVESISTLRVFGIQLRFDEKEYEWYECDADFTFNVRNYADDDGLPGDLIEEHLDIYATKIETGILYGGVYELIQWEIELPLVNVEHLSVQSASEGLDCWFLWMNSADGDSTSSRFSNGKWNAEPYDLSICVDE